MTTRTLIADDHRAVRDGVREVLAAEGDFEIVGEAEDGARALALARSLKPDLLVLDNSMPELTGVEVARRVVAELPDTAIVMLSLDPTVRLAGLAAGAVAHVAKDAPSRELVRGAREAQQALEARRAVARLSGDARRVADVLLENGALGVGQLAAALAARLPGESLATCLRRSRASDPDITAALAQAAGVELRSLAPREHAATVERGPGATPLDPIEFAAARQLPRRFCEARGCVLLSAGPDECVLALADPLDRDTPAEVEEILAGPPVTVVAATRADVREAIDRAHSFARPVGRSAAALA